MWESKPDLRTMDEFREDLNAVLRDLTNTLETKRVAYGNYGSSSLNRFGQMGIVMRCCDKIDRLINRFKDGKDSVGGMDTDTVEDSWRDLVGYAVLGWMEHRRNPE